MKTSTLRQLLTVFAITSTMNAIAMPPMTMPTAHAAAMPNMPLAPPKDVHVEGAWIRAAPPGATMLAGYMTLRNDGKTPQRFVSAQSDAFGTVELHKSEIVEGVSTMRAAGDQVIPAGGALHIAPGRLHLMLMEPKRALKPGEQVHFRLHFADGSALGVEATVRATVPPTTVP